MLVAPATGPLEKEGAVVQAEGEVGYRLSWSRPVLDAVEFADPWRVDLTIQWRRYGASRRRISIGRWRGQSLPAGSMLAIMEIQLREYRIRHGQMNEWISRWKSQIVPLRAEAGFHVIGAWVVAPDDRFVWLLSYSGTDGFEAADDRYYASQERRGVHPDPSTLVVEARHSMVDAVV